MAFLFVFSCSGSSTFTASLTETGATFEEGTSVNTPSPCPVPSAFALPDAPPTTSGTSCETANHMPSFKSPFSAKNTNMVTPASGGTANIPYEPCAFAPPKGDAY